jgi:N-acyl-D-aspartate/D-glutamate deacylase
MHDTIIRGGTVIDGRGGPARQADVAIADGRIVEIGRIAAPARQTIDADGAIVTPGFIDPHSHYDGQVMWDDTLDPSFSHGVTTTIAGNCGVGFAPAREEDRQGLIEFMSGVEDIPGIVLDEGLDWGWRSFPDYLNRVAARRYAMDVAFHVTHAPLRVHVMGERALRHEAATDEDIAEMAQQVREGMAAGAVGFSTGRIVEHRSSKGNHVPGTFALENEVVALARAMGAEGRGVFQVAPKGQVGSLFLPEGDSGREARLAEHRLLETIAARSGRPVTYGVIEVDSDPDDIRVMIEESDRAIARGVPVYPQITSRGGGQIYMLDGYHVFLMKPSYREIAHLPLKSRIEAMREPARREAILAEPHVEGAYADDHMTLSLLRYMLAHSDDQFILQSSLDFEPGPERRLAALAAATNRTPEAYLYDHYTSGEGDNFSVNFVVNYSHGSLETTRGFLMNPNVVSGLADGGAHIKVICDASLPTFQLAYWTRSRRRGEPIPLEFMVAKLTSSPARLYGLTDRGALEVGRRADINVIDHARLNLKMPRMVHDLPSGSGRLLQDSEGYLATLVAGVTTRRHDQDTGARPGGLIRATALA